MEQQHENKKDTLVPSNSSSPSHDFSFTISLHSTSTTTTTTKTTTIHDHKTLKNNNPFAIDLSPADDIFFHGHLLPLHLLSHLPVSPRDSINSLDNFTLPIPFKEFEKEQHQTVPIVSHANANTNTDYCFSETKPNNKSKNNNFSLFFGLNKKWRKGYEDNDTEKEKQKENKRKALLRFDVSRELKRYLRVLFRSRTGGRDKKQFKKEHQQAYSFSGNLLSSGGGTNAKQEMMMRGRGFSAPVSMRTSPTNSGLLVPHHADSSMEELQAAIQSAIAHCKKSISVQDDKIQ